MRLAGLAYGQALRCLVGLWGWTKRERGVRDGLPVFSLWISVWGERPLRQRGPRWGDAVSPFSIPWDGPLEMTFLERNMLVIS